MQWHLKQRFFSFPEKFYVYLWEVDLRLFHSSFTKGYSRNATLINEINSEYWNEKCGDQSWERVLFYDKCSNAQNSYCIISEYVKLWEIPVDSSLQEI